MRSHFQTQTDLNAVNDVLEWFDRLTQNLHPPELRWKSQIALVEGFTNAVRHAHRGLSSSTPIDLELTLFEGQMELRIWDWGQPFDLDTKLEELLQNCPEDPLDREAGRGLILIQKVTDELYYERTIDGQNCLTVRKYFNRDTAKNTLN